MFDSLCKTLDYRLERCANHGLRFDSLRSSLEERRRNLPGEVLWDGVVAGFHFELQADVEEVQGLRARAEWFDTLNAYRSSFFHNGWRHGSGHFDADDLRAASKAPSMNALLVPDRSSLRSRSKPHEWTYNDGRTVDSVAETVRAGLDKLLRAIFEGPWRTPEPASWSAFAIRAPKRDRRACCASRRRDADGALHPGVHDRGARPAVPGVQRVLPGRPRAGR